MTVQELIDALKDKPRDATVLVHQYYMDGDRKGLNYAKITSVREGTADRMELECMDWDIAIRETGLRGIFVVALETN